MEVHPIAPFLVYISIFELGMLEVSSQPVLATQVQLQNIIFYGHIFLREYARIQERVSEWLIVVQILPNRIVLPDVLQMWLAC